METVTVVGWLTWVGNWLVAGDFTPHPPPSRGQALTFPHQGGRDLMILVRRRFGGGGWGRAVEDVGEVFAFYGFVFYEVVGDVV